MLQCCQHHAGKVDKAHPGTTVAPFAANGGFDTADSGIIVGILRFDTQLDKLGDHDLIVVKRRHAKAAADHLHAGVEEIITDPGVIAHAEVGLRRTQTATGFQNGVREWVDCVTRLAIDQLLAADGNVLIQRATGGSFGVRAGADLVHFQQFQPAAVQHFDGFFARQALLQLHITAIPRIQILVEAAKGYGVAVRFDLQEQLNEVTQLQRLPEGLWWLMSDQFAVGCHG
ncbi:hypothetical protein D3C79_449180 [compost metagenome]